MLNVKINASMYKFYDENKKHLHTFNDKPLLGTSTVVNVIAKPLTWWASGMAVGCLGWLNPKHHSKADRLEKAADALETIKLMDSGVYLEILDKAYQAHNENKELSADKGTDMHEQLELYVKDCLQFNNGEPIEYKGDHERVSLFASWAMENVKRFLWSEIHCYSERMWVGGISDVGAEMLDGKIAIIDFKSSKEAYESQFIQIAGYDIQLSENGGFNNKGERTLEPISAQEYIVIPFGAPKFEVFYRFNTEQLRRNFESALDIYKTLNK